MSQPQLAFSSLSPAARSIWAKSGANRGHGLLAHLLDVAAVVEAILEREPKSSREWAAAQFGVGVELIVRWLAALAGLHDFGKAVPGFQLKWPEGLEANVSAGLSFTRAASSVSQHDHATAALLERALSETVELPRNWLNLMVRSTAAHHGYHLSRQAIIEAKPKGEPLQWQNARAEILAAYWQTLAPADVPRATDIALPALNWFAGLTSVADWIASNVVWFPQGERADRLSAYYEQARELARGALDSIGWCPPEAPLVEGATTDALVGRMLSRPGVEARPLQSVGDHLLNDSSGPTLLVVEAPMGEGKTELAFLAYLRLQARNGHRGLYLAMPTQATGNAMHERASLFLQGFESRPVALQLVHGGAALQHVEHELHDVGQSQYETVSAAAWFAQRRRPLLAPYGVGTVDQAVLAILNIKHHFVRLWGLGNRVIVIDEVHAYDTYTSGLIASLLRWLKSLNCSVVLMSATLPADKRAELFEAWGGIAAQRLPDLPYPRVLCADTRGIRGEHFTARPLPRISILGMDESLETLATQALRMLAHGGCGAIIVNSVGRAQQLFEFIAALPECPKDRILLHARMPADERALREEQVLKWFGAQGERPRKALLVGTQVVEQSLDLDFDFMLSDLAPIDLLLQRAGRLHRHNRERPSAHRSAVLRVAGLEAHRFPDLKTTAWGYIYDPYILGRTWALLTQEEMLRLPEDIDRLVQAVYGDQPLPDGLEEVVRSRIEVEAYGEHLARVKHERRQSTGIALQEHQSLSHAYSNKPRGNEEGEGEGLVNQTRLGAESITLIPVEVLPSGDYAVGTEQFQPGRPIAARLAQRLFQRHIKVQMRRVTAHFMTQEAPPAFAENALLRHCRMLPLTNGAYEAPGLHLTLSPELGLVIG